MAESIEGIITDKKGTTLSVHNLTICHEIFLKINDILIIIFKYLIYSCNFTI